MFRRIGRIVPTNLNVVSDVEQAKELITNGEGWFIVPIEKFREYNGYYFHDATVSQGIITDNRANIAFVIKAPTVDDAVYAVLQTIIENRRGFNDDRWFEYQIWIPEIGLDLEYLLNLTVQTYGYED